MDLYIIIIIYFFLSDNVGAYLHSSFYVINLIKTYSGLVSTQFHLYRIQGGEGHWIFFFFLNLILSLPDMVCFLGKIITLRKKLLTIDWFFVIFWMTWFSQVRYLKKVFSRKVSPSLIKCIEIYELRIYLQCTTIGQARPR